MKTIYFDMDGTIADLYGVEKWLPKLQENDASPYKEAKPLCDMEKLSQILKKLQAQGFEIGIITWLSKNAEKEYKKEIVRAKKEWLQRYLQVQLDEAHFVQYGTRKDYVAKNKNGILFDDDDRVRATWRGESVNPKETDIVSFLERVQP